MRLVAPLMVSEALLWSTTIRSPEVLADILGEPQTQVSLAATLVASEPPFEPPNQLICQ